MSVLSVCLFHEFRHSYKYVAVEDCVRQRYINYLAQDICDIDDLNKEDARRLLESEMNMTHYVYDEGDISDPTQVAYSVVLYRYVKIDLRKCADVEEYAFVLCHEFCHIKYFTGNEIYTQFLTFRTLYESNNDTLKTIGKWFGIYALNKNFVNSYDCSKLIIDYLEEKTNG